MANSNDSLVTAVIINYKTPDLTSRAVNTFVTAYPNISILLIDNGSGDIGDELLAVIESNTSTLQLIVNPTNLHHGPAMHQAMGLITTPFVLFLDSDCIVEEGGFIELMTHALSQHETQYAAGSLLHVNKRGFLVDSNKRGAIPYIHPYCMMVKHALYATLPPFELHGTPVLRNLLGAAKKGFRCVEIALEPYVTHEFRGTAGRFGYQLGFKGRLNYLLNRVGL